MSYQVLARKWRPQGFATLVGQQHVVKALSHALTSQRLHHAYLFTGTRGVGKTTLSRILAKSLNCDTGITATPCGICSACTDIDAGVFTDYVEMDAASNRGVEDMTALLDRAAYAPARGRYKIYMIDEVHMLSNTAFNAMLKTLEEPPDYLKFILATTDPQKIPVTVLSRCLQFSLKPMTVLQVADYLAHVMLKEQVLAEPLALDAIAKAAQGSMRDALSILDQAIAYGAGTVTALGVQQMLGVADTSGIYTLMQHLAERDMTHALGQAQQLLDAGVPAHNVLDEMAQIASQLAIFEYSTQTAKALHDPALATLLGRFTPEHLQLIYGIATKAQADVPYAPNAYAALAMPILRMQIFAPQAVQAIPVSPTPVLITSVGTAAPSTLVPASVATDITPTPFNPLTVPANRPKPPAAPPPPLTQRAALYLEHPEQWPAIATALPLKSFAYMAARQSACTAIDGLNIYLALNSAHLAEQTNILRMQEALRAASQQDYVLHVTVVETSNMPLNQTAAAHAAAEQALQQTEAEQTFANAPLVKKLVGLGGYIVAGSIKPASAASAATHTVI